MNGIQKFISKVLIISILFSTGMEGIFASEFEDGGIDGASERRALLDNFENTSHSSEAQIQYENTSQKEIQYTHPVEEESITTLLAAKEAFEESGENQNVTPDFITDPFLSINIPSSEGVVSIFLGGVFGSGTTQSLGENKISYEIGRKINISERKIQKKRISSTRGNISIQVASGTIITGSNGEIIDASSIDITPIDTVKKTKAKREFEKKMKNRFVQRKSRSQAQVDGFEFGIPSSHLIFSKPVAITIETPNTSDGIQFDLLTLHAGDKNFNTSGLSVDETTLCNSDGSASIPGSQAIVKNGKIVFYTCGASSFTMNPVGGTTTSNDIKLIIGDCGQIQIYYKGNPNIYSGNPSASGCGGNSSWPRLRVGSTDIGNGGSTAWSGQTTTGSQVGNTYTATTTLQSPLIGGRLYNMTINWSYVAPNSFFKMDYILTIPSGNTQNVKFYYGMDSFVNGNDTNDIGYYTGGTNPIAGIYDSTANQLLGIKYISGQAWAGYESAPYGTISSRITSGANFNNTTQLTSGDLGFGVNWDFGTGTIGTFSGSSEWRMLPYVAGSFPDLVPSIGQPNPSFTVNQTSLLPILITNAGNAASTGTTTNVFTIPTNFTGATSPFTDNGWSCGAAVGMSVTCTKSGSITPSGTDGFSIPLKPLPAAGGGSANFTTSITNAGDSNTGNNSATITLQVNVATQTQSLWLKADAGTNCISTGCAISAWNDQSGLRRNATQGTAAARPIYVPNAVNGNPAINFNTTAKVMTGLSGTRRTIFAVRNLSATTGFHTLFASTANTDFSIRNNSGFNGITNLNYTEGPNAQDWSNATGSPTNFYVDGKQTLVGKTQYHIVRASAASAITNTYSISSTFSSRGMSGSDAVAEIIGYNNLPSAGTIDITESYLALKYGITLDQTTPRNYVFSDGGIAWNASSAGVYKNDIAGIGRDTGSSLFQEKSQSINNTTDIIVETGSIANDKQAMVWANNGASTGSITSVPAFSGMNRILRAWKIEENNGDIGMVKVSYPDSVISPVFSNPVLIISTDGSFSSGTTSTISGSLNGGNWEYLANIPDGSVISFGELGDITPPTITSTNIASGTLIPSGNFGITVVYSDTGSSINVSSFTGEIYAWNATGSTWGLIDIAPSYMNISGSPTSSTGNLQVTNLPFGKYRFDISVSDTAGNTTTQSFTYFVDKIEWTVSAPLFSIGSIQSSILGFGTGELIVTVKTIGAGFNLSMIRTGDLATITDNIPVYNGTNGWGYDQWNGSSYPGVLLPHSTTQNLATVSKNINPNGFQNTFTYRIKYGVNAASDTPAGDYSGQIQFGINLNY